MHASVYDRYHHVVLLAAVQQVRRSLFPLFLHTMLFDILMAWATFLHLSSIDVCECYHYQMKNGSSIKLCDKHSKLQTDPARVG